MEKIKRVLYTNRYNNSFLQISEDNTLNDLANMNTLCMVIG